MIRTFHPVGQGAFYAEMHEYNGGTFTIVYDCGSGIGNNTPKIVESEIKKTFNLTQGKKHVIDVLFISHFHADHINGIKFLKDCCEIKTVVIPLLKPKAKKLTKLYNLIEKNFSETEIFDNPSIYFAESTKIIEIEEGNENENQIEINSDNKIEISNIQSQSTKSGTIFTFDKIADWYFIPYNYKQDELVNIFEDYLLIKYKIDINNIVTIDDILKYKYELRKAYKFVNKNLNNNSLILYSGKITSNKLKINFSTKCLHFKKSISQVKALKLIRILQNTQSGCLYTGDIDLNQNNIVNNIKRHYINFLPYIGTIQIPHHGSKLSFNPDIIVKTNVHAIVSYGENTYGHPSKYVLHDLCLKKILVHHVTSISISKYEQHN